MSNRIRFWIIGAVLLLGIVFGAVWLFYIQPTNDEIESVEIAISEQQSQTTLKEVERDALKAHWEKREEYKAELEELRISIPAQLKLQEYIEHIDKIALESNVVVHAFDIGTPFLPSFPQAAPAPAPETEDGTTSEGSEATPAPEQPATPAPPSDAFVPMQLPGYLAQNWVFVPITITVDGDYATTQAFIKKLQEESERLTFATGIEASWTDPTQDNSNSAGLTFEVNAYIYAVQGSDIPITKPAPEDLPEMPASNNDPMGSLEKTQ